MKLLMNGGAVTYSDRIALELDRLCAIDRQPFLDKARDRHEKKLCLYYRRSKIGSRARRVHRHLHLDQHKEAL